MRIEEDERPEQRLETGAWLEGLRVDQASEWFTKEDESRVFARIMKEIDQKLMAPPQRAIVMRPWLVAVVAAAAIALTAIFIVCPGSHSGVA